MHSSKCLGYRVVPLLLLSDGQAASANYKRMAAFLARATLHRRRNKLDVATTTHFVRPAADHRYCFFWNKHAVTLKFWVPPNTKRIPISVAAMCWMCGGFPRYLRATRTGSPTINPLTQAMCHAWQGPHNDSMRDRACQTFLWQRVCQGAHRQKVR